MDISIEKVTDTSLGSLFQQIINDMKNSSPLWEDFIIKATKLHACLRAAIQAISVYLEAFQKIADAATNSKGASKEIGTALTRVCLRHKAVETRMKTFTTAIMDSLIIPLQDKVEEWKRQVVVLDKEHTKEYKRCRNELKKRSTDTLRLQKKAKKSTSDNLQSLVDSSMHTVNQQRAELEDVERKSLRSAMIEDRTRFCTFVNMLQPVVKHEYEMMYELGHLQEAMQTVTNVTKDPAILPQASEELILESKTSYNLYPDSPSGSNSQGGCSNSLGSRKSSVCSISSMNSSSSGSPGHQFQRSLSQYNPAIRLKPGESSDSGFCSSPALTSQVSTATSQSHAVSTWPPHVQEAVSSADRPHTISTAYERGHQRPALTVYTFQNPETISETSSQKSPGSSTISCRPPLPIRCSSLERPLSASSNTRSNTSVNTAANARQCPSPIPAHVAKEHPTYVNMSELASMAASKTTNNSLNNTSNNHHQQQSATIVTTATLQSLIQPHSPALSTTSSLVSPDSTATNPISNSSPDLSVQTPQNTPQSHSPLTPLASIGILSGSYNDLTTPTNAFPAVITNTIDNNIKNTAELIIGTKGIFDTDLKSSGSVLDKASMFEKKQEEVTLVQPPLHPITLPQTINNNLTPATVARLESIYGKKTEEIYNKAAAVSAASLLVDRDSVELLENGTLDAIDTVELDNLIGELDLFQKEHEQKEKERHDKENLQNNQHQQRHNHMNGNVSEYHTPRSFHPHNDSLISTSTMLTGMHSNNSSSTDTTSDKVDNKASLSNSLNYSTLSNATLSDVRFNYSDSELSKYWHDNNNDLSADTGFENPSFVHLNDTNIVVIRENEFPSQDNYYSQNSTEIVVLRCKDVTKLNGSNNNSITDLNLIESSPDHQLKQRFSSFKSENNNSITSNGGSPIPQILHQLHQQSQQNYYPTSITKSSSHNPFASMYGPVDDQYNNHSNNNNVNVNNNINVVNSKPAITPRPASLLSGISRIARRSSVNAVKPPPPVRRSSSVTPSLGSEPDNSQNSLQHQQFNVSSESLPPPPAYLLDRAHQQQQQQQQQYAQNQGHYIMPTSTSMGPLTSSVSAYNVAGQVKSLNDKRHTPASPGVMRRQLALSTVNHHPTANHTPQSHNVNFSSQPSTPKMENSNSNNSMFSIYGATTGNGTSYGSNNEIFSSTMPRQPKPTPQPQQQGIYAQPKQIAAVTSFRTSCPSPAPAPKSTGLLAQLTARIVPNKTPKPPVQVEQQQPEYERTRNDPPYLPRRNSQPVQSQYYDNQSIYSQQPQLPPANDGKYSTSQHHHQNYQIHHQQQQQQQQQQPTSIPQQQYNMYSQNIYVSTNPFITSPPSNYSPSSFGKETTGNYPSYQTGNYAPEKPERTTLSKTAFLDNLNAKLAEQQATNKAYAVRSYINSKVVPSRNHFSSQIPCNIKYVVPNRITEDVEPDPRIVRESLMDQIKRGPQLKQNRTVNDRSDPKI